MTTIRQTLACIVAATLSSAIAGASLAQAPRSEARDQRERPAATSQKSIEPSTPKKAVAAKAHKLAIQVAENRPEIMNLALNNAKNVIEYYRGKGETVAVEIVTFGPGLHMLRDDTSPVKQRVAEMSLAEPSLTFIACANTQANQSKQEQKQIALVSEAKVMPSGVVRLMELQKQGYTYIRP